MKSVPSVKWRSAGSGADALDLRLRGFDLAPALLLLQLLVDRHGGGGAFGGRNRDEVHVAGGIPGHEHVGDVGALPVVGPQRTLVGDSAAERATEQAALIVRGREEQGVAGE